MFKFLRKSIFFFFNFEDPRLAGVQSGFGLIDPVSLIQNPAPFSGLLWNLHPAKVFVTVAKNLYRVISKQWNARLPMYRVPSRQMIQTDQCMDSIGHNKFEEYQIEPCFLLLPAAWVFFSVYLTTKTWNFKYGFVYHLRGENEFVRKARIKSAHYSFSHKGMVTWSAVVKIFVRI